MALKPVPCQFCCQAIVWISTQAGARLPIDAQSFPLAEVPPGAQYGIKTYSGVDVVVPLDGDRPRNGMCNTRHKCAGPYDRWAMRNVSDAAAVVPEALDMLF